MFLSEYELKANPELRGSRLAGVMEVGEVVDGLATGESRTPARLRALAAEQRRSRSKVRQLQTVSQMRADELDQPHEA